MSYIKIQPRSDDALQAALNKAKERKDAVDPDNNILSPANSVSLDLLQPELSAKRNAVAIAEEADHQAVIDSNNTIAALRSYASHGLQLVVFLVSDHFTGFTAATLKLYNLPLDGKLPVYDTDDKVLAMGNDFIQGETDRIAAGGVALPLYTKTVCQTMVNTANAKRLAKEVAHEALVPLTQDLQTTRASVDKLITKIWKDIDNATQGMTKEAARNFSKTWGVVYTHIGAYGTLHIQVVDADSNIILAGVEFQLGPTGGKAGAKGKTNNFGFLTLESINFEPTQLTGKLALYADSVDDVTIIEGEEVYITVKMQHLPKPV